MAIYCPPDPLDDFVDEVHTLSSIPNLECLILGDMNIHLDKPYAEDFLSLLNSFGLKLDLVLTRNCKAYGTLVTPLHISDTSSFIFLFVFHRNLSVCPPHTLPVVTPALPPPSMFYLFEVNTAIELLSSCLDSLYPLSTKPVHSIQPCLWLTHTIQDPERSVVSGVQSTKKGPCTTSVH